MPQKVWTVGEEVLAADFNTYVQNQVVPAFPNAAARDTWASPPNGAMCVLTDTYRTYVRVAGAWQAVPMTQGGINNYTGDGAGNFSIVFPRAFPAAATVVVATNASFGNVNIITGVPTTTQCQCGFRRTTDGSGVAGTGMTVSWIAVLM